MLLLSAITTSFVALPPAHFDALDGPIVQDVRKALDTKDATPILKWVKQEDETTVREAFVRALHARNKKMPKQQKNGFMRRLSKSIWLNERFLLPALKLEGQSDPVIAVIDQALESGSPDALLKHFTEDIAHGIRKRYKIVEAAYRHKDESTRRRAFC